jgi:1,4-dihydroxy-2-naphthoate octaprenyltransferase
MWRTWFLAARPKTLFAGICPVVLGTALAEREGVAHPLAALAALLGAMSIQIGTNFCNDYFDFRQGADTRDRKGPIRAVAAGRVSPATMLAATFATFSITAAICVYLVARAGWPLAILGAISILCGVGYTATRFSLAYLGLGDLFVLVFFGPVAVAGTFYVQALRFSPGAAVAGIAPGLISVGILVVNNLRDIQEDAQANKRTLAVRWGATFARWEYTLCLLGAALVPPLLWLQFTLPPQITAASLALLPGLALVRQIWTHDGPSLNSLLGKTGGLLVLFTLVFSLVCILTAKLAD